MVSFKLFLESDDYKSRLSKMMSNPPDLSHTATSVGATPVEKYYKMSEPLPSDRGGMKNRQFNKLLFDIITLLKNDPQFNTRLVSLFDKFDSASKKEVDSSLDDSKLDIKLSNLDKNIQKYTDYIKSKDRKDPEILKDYKQKLQLAIRERKKFDKLIEKRGSLIDNTVAYNEKLNARSIEHLKKIVQFSASKLLNKFPENIRNKASQGDWLAQYGHFNNSPYAQAVVLNSMLSDNPKANPLFLYINRLARKYEVEKTEKFAPYSRTTQTYVYNLLKRLPISRIVNMIYSEEQEHSKLRLKNKKSDTAKPKKKPSFNKSFDIMNALYDAKDDIAKFEDLKPKIKQYISSINTDKHKKKFWLDILNGDFFLFKRGGMTTAPDILRNSMKSLVNELE